MTAGVVLLIGLMLVFASLPFVNHRVFVLGPRVRAGKPFALCLLELLVLGALALVAGVVLEARQGSRYPQGWEFYTAYACLFVTFGFPGFVWRFLRRQGAA